MRAAVGGANIVLGLAYLALGAIVVLELLRDRARREVGRMGAALAALTFTCGPLHLIHGVHVAFEHQTAGWLDLITVLVGLPPGVLFLWLRAKALTGRRGDRIITGTPGWIQVLPVAAGAYLAAVLTAGSALLLRATGLSAEGLLGLTTMAVFGSIAVMLSRTQVRNRAALGGWSLSGLGLSAIFATCATMHLAMAMELAAQVRPLDMHMVMVSAAVVAAGVWFQVVVAALRRAASEEWDAAGPATAAAA